MRRATPLLLAASLAAGGCAWSSSPLPPGRSTAIAASRILAADGRLVTTLRGEENREVVPIAQMPATVRNAVVAIEDERFWTHRGVDLRAVARAALANAGEGKVVEGGSTITQQYVKNELLDSSRTVRRKVREASL